MILLRYASQDKQSSAQSRLVGELQLHFQSPDCSGGRKFKELLPIAQAETTSNTEKHFYYVILLILYQSPL